jgi:gluconolactonase
MGAVETLATGFGWAEGPLWDADDGALVFTDVAADTIYALADGMLTPVVEGTSTFTNGLDYDAEGNRLECQHATQRVIERRPNGTTEVVAASFQGAPFNSPNDVIAHASGTIFFTDPTYGSQPDLGAAVPQQPWQGVYRVALDTGVVSLVDDQLSQPNGIALAPNHATLYVSDTENDVVVQYPVAADGTTGAGSVLANVASPDGLAVDVNGNLYVAAGTGVVVLAPDGDSWGTIGLTAVPTNVAFGGTDRRSLYVTTPGAVHLVMLGVPGVPASF